MDQRGARTLRASLKTKISYIRLLAYLIMQKQTSLLIGLFLFGICCGCTQEAHEEKVIDHVLTAAIDQCGDIMERAASHLVAIVEFQRLEIIGRKARVFKMCMQDHGYNENKDWLIYGQPVAEKVAKETQISVDEALENLRRAHMKLAQGEQDRPVYWIKDLQVQPES